MTDLTTLLGSQEMIDDAVEATARRIVDTLGPMFEERNARIAELEARIAALVAERDGLRAQVDLAREKLDHIERHDYDHKLSGTMNLALVQCTAIDALQALKEQHP